MPVPDDVLLDAAIALVECRLPTADELAYRVIPPRYFDANSRVAMVRVVLDAFINSPYFAENYVTKEEMKKREQWWAKTVATHYVNRLRLQQVGWYDPISLGAPLITDKTYSSTHIKPVFTVADEDRSDSESSERK